MNLGLDKRTDLSYLIGDYNGFFGVKVWKMLTLGLRRKYI